MRKNQHGCSRVDVEVEEFDCRSHEARKKDLPWTVDALWKSCARHVPEFGFYLNEALPRSMDSCACLEGWNSSQILPEDECMDVVRAFVGLH